MADRFNVKQAVGISRYNTHNKSSLFVGYSKDEDLFPFCKPESAVRDSGRPSKLKHL